MRVPKTPRPGFQVWALQVRILDSVLGGAVDEIVFVCASPLEKRPSSPQSVCQNVSDLLARLNLPTGSLFSADGKTWQDATNADCFWCAACRRITPESTDGDPNCQICGHAYSQPHPDDQVAELAAKRNFAELMAKTSKSNQWMKTKNSLTRELRTAVTEANWHARQTTENKKSRSLKKR
jgi:hypothetical protein